MKTPIMRIAHYGVSINYFFRNYKLKQMYMY